MHRALRRAGWVLAAGTLGWVVPAAAQAPPSFPVAADAVPQDAQMTDLGPVPEGYGRLAEIKVELAWLADPVTFPYRLGARATGAALEVRGFVPDTAVREQALKVAHDHSQLPVTDALRLHPTLSLPAVGVPAAEVRASAAAALAETFLRLTPGYEVTCNPSGRITVTGFVPSQEDRLEVSRRLRRVRGCTAVDNRLQASAVLHSGKAFTVLSADGQQLVAEELAAEEPPVSLTGTPATPPAAPPTAPPQAPERTQSVVLGPHVEPAPDKPAEAAPPFDARLVPLPVVTQPGTGLPPEAAARLAAPHLDAEPAGPRILPPDPDREPPVLPPEPPEPVTTTTVAKTPLPGLPEPPAPEPTSPRNGLLPTAPAAKPQLDQGPAPNTTLVEFAARLKRRVEVVCGGAAKGVEVHVRSATSLLICLKAPSTAVGEQLAGKVLSLPELGPYQVDLEVKTTPAP
jgi:hypothetical protein